MDMRMRINFKMIIKHKIYQRFPRLICEVSDIIRLKWDKSFEKTYQEKFKTKTAFVEA